MSFSVSVREHVMIAHSLAGEIFGPAQQMHGATYVVTATFRTASLDCYNLVIDIAEAHEALRSALEPINYQNLDDLSQFTGVITTTEFLAQWVHGELSARIQHTEVDALSIELRESHVAWAEYTAPIR